MKLVFFPLRTGRGKRTKKNSAMVYEVHILQRGENGPSLAEGRKRKKLFCGAMIHEGKGRHFRAGLKKNKENNGKCRKLYKYLSKN